MEQVKKLRAMTGAGVMDCKKALEAADGDFTRAVEWLRHKGIASAALREGREAKDGVIALYVEGTKGAVIELNCETDFVARTEDFQKLAGELARKVFDRGSSALNEEETLNCVRELSGKVGERTLLRRGEVLEAKHGVVASYLHSNKKIGVLVALEGDGAAEVTQQCGKDIAMQVAAARPLFVSREDIPQEILEREKELVLGDAAGKPREVQEKILQGKLAKWYEQVCLLEQLYIKNEDEKVRDYLAANVQAAGGRVRVRRFVRFELGA